MLLSFVIPAHDEEQCLGATIGAIRAAMGGVDRQYEIIVAADACTDATAAIAQAAGARVVSHERRQIAATRNLGARAATGSVLVFVDADTRVTPGALAQMLDLVRSGVAGGGGPVRLDGPLPLYVRLMMPVLLAAFRRCRLTGGAFFFCSREAFDAVGGWDEAYFAGEELVLARALKKVGRFELVRDPVITSGRKARTHSWRDLLGLLLRGVFNPSMVKDRSRLGIFYGARRRDPYPDRTPGEG